MGLVQSETRRRRSSRHSVSARRAGSPASEVPLCSYISKLAGKPAHKVVMLAPSFNVIHDGSRATLKLKSGIEKKYGQHACNVGDEGGFAPSVQDNNEALEFLRRLL